MDYINAFWVGGAICALVQILMEKTKMLPGRIMVMLVCLGALLGALGIYQPFIEFAGAGASVPLLGFGNTLFKGVKEAVDEYGFLGIMCRKKNRAGKSLQRLFQCTNLARSSSFHCYPCHSRWNDSTILIYLLCVMAMQVFCLYKFQHLGNPEIRVF